jgi:hypothetical protein
MTMHTLAAEFQEALQQYCKLTEVLKEIFGIDEPLDPQALVKSVLKNQDCLMQIQKMDARVLELSEILKRCSKELDPADCEKIRGYSSDINSQALYIQELCRVQEQRVRSRRDQIAKELREIANSARYFKVLKPPKNNFPKFIDSTG